MNRTRLTSAGRWLISCLIAGGTVAGCAGLPAKPVVPAPTGVATADATQLPASTAYAQHPAAAPSPPPLKLEPIPNPFEHRRLAPGEPIAQAGLFFMQVATGEVDAWALPGDDGTLTTYSASPDNRWVVARTSEGTLLADRRTGASYFLANGRVLAAQGEHVLLLVRGQVWVAEAGGPAWGPLATGPAVELAPQAVMSPDGEAAAILNGRTLYLAQLDNTSCRPIAEVADAAGHILQGLYLQTASRGEEIVVNSCWPEEPGLRQSLWRIERYSWQGERLGEVMLANPGFFAVSPDGRWLAWDEVLVDLVHTVVVADAATLAPRLRVVGAGLCFPDYGSGDWLADSSGLIVSTRAGYRILTLDGELTPAPTFRSPAGEPMPFPSEPLPAPDRSGLFAIGRRAVVDAAGRPVAVAALGVSSELGQPADLDPWGLDSSELRLALPHLGHGGKCGEVEYVVPTEVQWAPFNAPVLTVALPAGECADLRAAPGANGEVLACLAGGTRLALAPAAELAPLEGTLSYLTASVAWGDGLWLHVRAPGGQEGWVDAEAAQIGWAP